MGQAPAKTPGSEARSSDIKNPEFKRVGPVVAYSPMQAMGVVDDHLTSCRRHPERQGG